MQAALKPYLTPEEYLAFERQSEIKHEYFDGEVYAMTGGTVTHSQIVGNTVIALGNKLRNKPCRVLPSDMRVKVQATGLYTYPDVVVICGRVQLEDRRKDTVLNPTVLIEVLSPSTADYDRGTKFAHYRMLESLSDYLLIAQAEPLVEHYQRQGNNQWLLSTYKALDDVALLPSVGCELSLADIYHKVEWSEADSQPPKLRRVKEEAGAYDYSSG